MTIRKGSVKRNIMETTQADGPVPDENELDKINRFYQYNPYKWIENKPDYQKEKKTQ